MLQELFLPRNILPLNSNFLAALHKHFGPLPITCPYSEHYTEKHQTHSIWNGSSESGPPKSTACCQSPTASLGRCCRNLELFFKPFCGIVSRMHHAHNEIKTIKSSHFLLLDITDVSISLE